MRFSPGGCASKKKPAERLWPSAGCASWFRARQITSAQTPPRQ
jgi:hypothetical protein